MNFSEKDMEDAIANDPEKYIGGEGFSRSGVFSFVALPSKSNKRR